jgi:hypothetical protein
MRNAICIISKMKIEDISILLVIRLMTNLFKFISIIFTFRRLQ